METTVTERGQTAVPAKIRKRFGIRKGQKLEWAEDGNVIYLLPASKNPIKAFRGSSKGAHLNDILLRERSIDAALA